MLTRLRNALQYRLERVLLRGMGARLLVMAALVGAVSAVGGALVMGFDGSFKTPWQALWWAFLRLTDPGYLGDDQGTGRRAVSAVLTLLGYVIFMGSLVAIMTQWLNQTIRRLESGLAPIAKLDHVVVLGWTSRTPTIAREMFATEGRVARFLALHEASKLHFVLLVEELTAELRHDLRSHLGPLWREGQVVLRSGSPLRVDHLARVDYLHAAAILLPSDPVGGEEGLADAATIKTLRSIDAHSAAIDDAELPLIVTEIFDASKVRVAQSAYRGPLEVLSSDRFLGRLLALCVHHPGMSAVFDEVLAHGDQGELRVWEADRLVGTRFGDLPGHFPNAIVLGAARRKGVRFVSHVCPDPDATVDRGDRIVLLARSHEDATPRSTPQPLPEAPPCEAEAIDEAGIDSVLILGWSHRVPDMIAALAEHAAGDLVIRVLSTVPAAQRIGRLEDDGVTGIAIEHHEGDVTRSAVLARHLEAPVDRILLVASDRLDSGAESDARTILIHMQVSEALRGLGRTVPITIELMDATNRRLVEGPGIDVVVAPILIGRALAHVTLRPELRAVYDDLFDRRGAALVLRPPEAYGVDTCQHTFGELEAVVRADGDILLGMLGGPHGATPRLPRDKQKVFASGAKSLVVIQRGVGEAGTEASPR